MVEPTFEETAQKEYWLQIFREAGESGAKAKEKELREGGHYRNEQEVANNLAILEFRELENIGKNEGFSDSV